MSPKGQSVPRIVIAALRGGSGKTILTIGITAAWVRSGRRVAPFKKGPDYIDAGWLALAAGRPCYNLDNYLLSNPQVLASFRRHTSPGAIAVIEGNRGLFDCIDTAGATSTAELAKLLAAPVVLCLDATKTTRTMAAVVAGCDGFDPALRVRGVVLNRVAGPRHESILRRSIEEHCGIPVLGAIPKLESGRFPERHMGLVPTFEHRWARDAVDAAADMAAEYLDLDGLRALADSAPPAPVLQAEDPPSRPRPAAGKGQRPRIGILRDAAFQFYYPENIEALAAAGAETLFVSPLRQQRLPEVDGLYIGGGFPETHAAQLAENRSFREDVRRLAEDGAPVYAECGGLMYLGRKLVLDEGTFPMAGVLPVSFGFSARPQGHGYTVVRVEGDNPYFPDGTEFRGHEFHYSHVREMDATDADMVFRMRRGKGIAGGRDGLRYRNVLATYTHIHALGQPGWAPALVSGAAAYRRGRRERPAD